MENHGPRPAEALDPRIGPDDRPVVLLQCGVLHLWAGAFQLLRRSLYARAPVPPATCTRELRRPICAGALLRFHRSPQDDRPTYAVSGLLLAGSAIFFRSGTLTPVTQNIWFVAIFFVASSAASSAYLTVSEVFPLEIRAFAISIFYAIGTLAGGVGAPLLFSTLIQSGSRHELFWGYIAGALLMIAGAVTEKILGVDAERKSLESISMPLQTGD